MGFVLGLISLVLPLGLAGPAGRALHEAGKQLRYGAQAGAAELADRARRTGATDDLNCTDGTGDPWPEGEGGENCTVEFTGYLTDTRCIGWINGEDNTNITTAAPNVSRNPDPPFATAPPHELRRDIRNFNSHPFPK